MKKTALLAIFLMLFSIHVTGQSRTVAGVEVPESVTLNGVAKPLQLNGAGIRKKFFISVYVAALYLPARTNDAKALIQSPPPNRVLMHFV